MKIESNVAPPDTWTTGSEGSRGRPAKYPWSKMQVGDSLFFEDETTSSGSRPYLSAMQHGRNHGVKFTARKVDGGLRIWRIE